jgi:hypothetical protein
MHAWQEEEQPVRWWNRRGKKEILIPKPWLVMVSCGSRDRRAIPFVASCRFVTGRPVSALTTQFLQWYRTRLQAQGKTAWLLIWDNASWHVTG